jgi:hypothetical protein
MINRIPSDGTNSDRLMQTIPPLNTDVVLLFPPVAKPGEPPAGVAQLKQALEHHGHSCCVIDANIEGQLFLLSRPLAAESITLRSAQRNRLRNIARLRTPSTFRNFDRYKASVLELNRLLTTAAHPFNASLSFTDYQHEKLAPVRSRDLLAAAERPQDNPFFSYFEQQLRPRLEAMQPRLFGISLIYLSQTLTAFALIGWLRQTFPGVRIIVGGGLITSWKNPGWNEPFSGLIDACISGPGEEALLRELGHSSSGKRVFRPNYDDLPFDDYLSPGRILPYSASSGCYWRKCEFCPETAEENPFSPTPHDQVFTDLNVLAQHEPTLIHFLDNALSPALLKRLENAPLPAPWYGYARFTRELEDADFAVQLRRNGCVMLQLGLESGDQSVLDGMGKGITLPQASAVLRNLKNVGIATYIYLLFGTPWETEARARATIEFVAKHADCIDWINAAIFNLPANSAEAQRQNTRMFYAGDLTLYHNFEHPHGWNRPAVRQFLQNEFHAHPAIRKILLANPPSFTSNHAPFFTEQFIKSRVAHASQAAV